VDVGVIVICVVIAERIVPVERVALSFVSCDAVLEPVPSFVLASESLALAVVALVALAVVALVVALVVVALIAVVVATVEEVSVPGEVVGEEPNVSPFPLPIEMHAVLRIFPPLRLEK
jgi:hypothetical protein